MNWSIVKDLMLLFIGLGGVVVSAISVYRISTSSFQETLHTKQLDLCVEILSELDTFAVELFSLLTCAQGQHEKDSLGAGLLDVQTKFMLLRLQFKGYHLLLPAAVLQQLLAYLAVVDNVIFDPNDMKQGVRRLNAVLNETSGHMSTTLTQVAVDRLATAKPGDITAAFVDLLVVVRNTLGIDSLSKRTYELLKN